VREIIPGAICGTSEFKLRDLIFECKHKKKNNRQRKTPNKEEEWP
jgi:hypothetical protein